MRIKWAAVDKTPGTQKVLDKVSIPQLLLCKQFTIYLFFQHLLSSFSVPGSITYRVYGVNNTVPDLEELLVESGKQSIMDLGMTESVFS